MGSDHETVEFLEFLLDLYPDLSREDVLGFLEELRAKEPSDPDTPALQA